MMNILAGRGFRILREGRVTYKNPVTNLKHDALLLGQLLPSRGKIDRHKNVYSHWAIWDSDAQVVRDPYHYRKPLWLTNFYELGMKN